MKSHNVESLHAMLNCSLEVSNYDYTSSDGVQAHDAHFQCKLHAQQEYLNALTQRMILFSHKFNEGL